jgi:hypothetical protein
MHLYALRFWDLPTQKWTHRKWACRGLNPSNIFSCTVEREYKYNSAKISCQIHMWRWISRTLICPAPSSEPSTPKMMSASAIIETISTLKLADNGITALATVYHHYSGDWNSSRLWVVAPVTDACTYVPLWGSGAIYSSCCSKQKSSSYAEMQDDAESRDGYMIETAC